MCRMMCIFGPSSQSIPESYLKEFIHNCHWGNRSRQDWFGHHGKGWGIAWLDQNGAYKTKRFTSPIWYYQWKKLLMIRSRFIAIHARFAFKFEKENIQPIQISHKNQEFIIFHNGMFHTESIPVPQNSKLREISSINNMDTRKFLAAVIDKYKNISVSSATKIILDSSQMFNSANSFILSKDQLDLISYHKPISPIKEIHTYHLNYKKLENRNICVSVLPFEKDFKIIPNKISISYNFSNDKIKIQKL
jgi:predicted glutamine amidotransferase